MYSLVVSKATNKIIFAVLEGSVGMVLITPQQHLETHCESNDLDPNDYFAVGFPWNKKERVNLDKDIYNPTTGLFEPDPNYVPTTPTSTPADPTA